MKKRLLVVGFLVLASAGSDLLACGDKFLMPSRGTRFTRAGVLRQPAAILVYANPSSTLPQALSKVDVTATLRKVGYRPTSVSGPAELEAALRQGGWDLVVTDLSDGQSVRGRLQGTGAPAVLPVAFNATSANLAQAKKDYQHILKGTIKSQAFIEAIDDALALREKLRAKSKATA